MANTEQQFTKLSNVDPMMNEIKVKVRCISMWHSHPAGKEHELYSIDLVIQDEHNVRSDDFGNFVAVETEVNARELGSQTNSLGTRARLDFEGSSKKTRKAKDYSPSSSEGSPPARHRHTLEKSKTYSWGRNDDKSGLNHLSPRKKSAFERLSDTYSPSTTKSGPSRASFRDHSQGRNRSRVKDLLHGVEE
ncbi:hypothetical protein Tco_0979446 [Tanacetum coccineum]